MVRRAVRNFLSSPRSLMASPRRIIAIRTRSCIFARSSCVAKTGEVYTEGLQQVYTQHSHVFHNEKLKPHSEIKSMATSLVPPIRPTHNVLTHPSHVLVPLLSLSLLLSLLMVEIGRGCGGSRAASAAACCWVSVHCDRTMSVHLRSPRSSPERHILPFFILREHVNVAIDRSFLW